MSFVFENTLKINLPKKAENPFVRELLANYTYGACPEISYCDNENQITLGNFKKAECKNSESIVNITDGGVYIEGCDYPSAMRGLITFLEQIKYDYEKNCFFAENNLICENPKISFRCVHVCIFPETDIIFLKKFVRSCAVAKFTHIIFEFWGTLKFDCLKELSWKNSYSKSEIKDIVSEANAMGAEIIPMFNHLGHASSCREVSGKHVVLDQNPKLEFLFDSYGWIWNIDRKDVRELHRKIREELIEVCGVGKYFHLGCDEAYKYGHIDEKASEMCEYLNEIAKELEKEGRRPIIWHDMLLAKDEFCEDGYNATSMKSVSDMLLSKLDKNIIIADWQYSVKNELWKSTKKIKENGFDVVCCPWHKAKNILEAVSTADEYNAYGIIHTTWDTQKSGFREMIFSAMASLGKTTNPNSDFLRFYCAHIVRKAMPPHGDYEKSGWIEKMVDPRLM